MPCFTCHRQENSRPRPGDGTKNAGTGSAASPSTFRPYVTRAGNRGRLDGPSRLCMSCHDGVTATDTHLGSAFPESRRVLGPDLSDDHPVGVPYPPRDREGSMLGGYLPRPLGGLPLPEVNGVPRVECTSCHDPHGSVYEKLLREQLFQSRLCFRCHDL